MSFYFNNSVTKQKDEFLFDKNKTVNFYTCGPTVYDSAHLGHARTYMSMDIIRRVLENYGYKISFAMNITDIDDKIINKVNEIHSSKKDLNDTQKIDIFFDFIKKMEANFWTDMESLGIKKPHIITRVTEHIPEMIDYIKKMMDNGYAYVSNGSVYFDSEAYQKAGLNGLQLKEFDSDDYILEKEFQKEKKNKNDFALWKAVKPGEISFEAPQLSDNKDDKVEGRPGWHLECSVMINEIYGHLSDNSTDESSDESLHVHCGGIDLLFPHHNNECLQANAFHNKKDFQWTKFFLHTGHLMIKQGKEEVEKMSKSLGNFVSIRNYLENVGTAEELRILFLLHKWDKPLEYSENTVEESKMIYNKISAFFDHIKFVNENDCRIKKKYEKNDKEYLENFNQTKLKIDKYLKDNMDTGSCMKQILEDISRTYIYLDTDFNMSMVNDFSGYCLELFRMFGLNSFSITEKKVDIPEELDIDKCIELGVNFREDVRKTVMKYKKELGKNNKEFMKDIFTLLDEFRDIKMKKLGLTLQDTSKDGKTKWNYKY